MVKSMMDCSDNILDAEYGQTKQVKANFVSSKSKTLSKQWIAGEILDVYPVKWHSKEDYQQTLATL